MTEVKKSKNKKKQNKSKPCKNCKKRGIKIIFIAQIQQTKGCP